MEHFNWLLQQVMAEQALRRSTECPLLVPERHSGVKRSLATTLVRLGLRLDPAAGEGLGSPPLPMAQSAGRLL